MCAGYVWIDAIRRERLRHLAGEVFVVKFVIPVFWIGSIGWALSLFALAGLMLGIFQIGRLAFQL
ncbi:hypothetical protein KT71_06604 [Congregibacter litoralis KT71]|uniref:Uncharacterized protein n=1 Tax=Congregibacter litoralis KT71 TaxID=314285 RepID=A4ABC0_9GAMM|nr:hypothetical protein KT71_06604 [Congregibacter litoralis KT71]